MRQRSQWNPLASCIRGEDSDGDGQKQLAAHQLPVSVNANFKIMEQFTLHSLSLCSQTEGLLNL